MHEAKMFVMVCAPVTHNGVSEGPFGSENMIAHEMTVEEVFLKDSMEFAENSAIHTDTVRLYHDQGTEKKGISLSVILILHKKQESITTPVFYVMPESYERELYIMKRPIIRSAAYFLSIFCNTGIRESFVQTGNIGKQQFTVCTPQGAVLYDQIAFF